MMRISKEEIVQKIISSKNISREQVEEKIKAKINTLSNLVSEQGAAYIVANELGVNLNPSSESGFLKINQLSHDMRNVNVYVRMVNLEAVREFEKKGIPSKVANVLVSDGTGNCRLVIWDSRVSKFENGEIKPNDILKVTSCYVKNNEYSGMEIHMRDKSALEINPADAPDLPEITSIKINKENFGYTRKNISEIGENERVEILGTIVQVFMQRPFYEVCSECGARVKREETKFSCRQHGIVKPAYKMVMGIVLDDSTGNVKTTFFGKNVEELISMTSMEAFEKATKMSDELIAIKEAEPKLLGKQIIVKGKVRLNSYSGNIELIANEVEKDINFEKEISNIKSPQETKGLETSNSFENNNQIFSNIKEEKF